MAEDVTRAETRGSLLLWFGILASPLAWTAQVIVAPDLAEILCYPGAETSGQGEIWGFSIEVFLIALTGALAAVAGLAIAVSVVCWRRVRSTGDRTQGSRATWMALAGILVSGLFLMAIVIGFIPMLFLDPCMVSP